MPFRASSLVKEPFLSREHPQYPVDGVLGLTFNSDDYLMGSVQGMNPIADDIFPAENAQGMMFNVDEIFLAESAPGMMFNVQPFHDT